MTVTLEEIMEELKKIKPEKVLSIRWEYPGYISLSFGLNHEGMTQEIALGDIDETDDAFSWNSNSFDDVEISGDLPKKETAQEMARDFLLLIESKLILAGLCETCGACGLAFFFSHICDENPLWEVLAWHEEQFTETSGQQGQEKENEMHSDFIDILRKAVSR